MISKGFKIYFEYKGQEILLSEYTSLKVSTNTLDEELNEEENGRYSLSFKVPKKLENTTNLPADFDLNKYLKIGRKLRLDVFSKGDLAAPETIYFIISSIAPEGSNDNIMWSIQATDYLSFIFSKNNTELTLDTLDDEDYFDWLEETKETEIDIDFNQRLYDLDLFRVGTVKDIAEYILYKGNLRNIKDLENSWKIDYQNKEDGAIDVKDLDPAHEKVSISLSSSNTYNGLVELTFLTNSTLHIDYKNKTLRFRSKDSDYFRKNYVLSPEFNLQDLSLNYNSETFYPLFFVTGGEDDLGLSVGIIPYLSYAQYSAIKKNIDLIRNPNTTTPFAVVLNGEYSLSLENIEGLEKEFRVLFDDSNKFPASKSSVWESIKFNSNLLSSSITIKWANGGEKTFKHIAGHILKYLSVPQRIEVLNKEGALIFSIPLSKGKYDEDEYRRYFDIEIKFNSDIDPSEYEDVNILGESSNGYYTNLFSNIVGKEVLHALNFIPYLDTFILTLDYFLNNDFLDVDEILDIKNRIYNDLRYINLDYQLAIFNKYTIEGQIRETEQKILNYSDQLASKSEIDYSYVNGELQNIFFREGGGTLRAAQKNIGFKRLNDTWDLPIPNSESKKTFRELMAGGFFFYEISQDEYLEFQIEGRAEWEGEIPIPNKVIYNYNDESQNIFMASHSFTSQYPFEVTIKANEGSVFESINDRVHYFNDNTEEMVVDEATEGLKDFDFSSFSNPASYRFFISGDFTSKNIANIVSPNLKLEASQYIKRWKKYNDDNGNSAYPTYITNLPNAINGPLSAMLVTKNPSSDEFTVRRYDKQFKPPTSYDEISFGDYFSYRYRIVAGVRWAHLLSPPISLENIKYSSTIKLYIDVNTNKDENSSYTSWFLQESPAGYRTGLYLSKSGLPSIFVPFSRLSGKRYYVPTDPNFNLGAYEGYDMMVSFALNQTNSDSSLEDFFSWLEVDHLIDIKVSEETAYSYSPASIFIDELPFSSLPVVGTIKIPPTDYYLGVGDLFNYQYRIVADVRWARLISPPISLEKIKYSSTIKLYIDANKDENSSYTSWFLQENQAGYRTGIYLTKSGLPDIFVPFSRLSGKGYYVPTDPNFNLSAYEGYDMMVSFALNQTNSDSSLEGFFSRIDIGDLTYIRVSEQTASGPDSTIIYNPVLSPNTDKYSYKVERLDLSPQATHAEFQKFEWYPNPNRVPYSGTVEAIVNASNIAMDTWAVNTGFETYGYFDLLSLYKGSNYVQARLDNLIKSIKEYIDERIIIENNLTIVQSELGYVSDPAELKALEAQVATLEKDLNAYKTVVGNWTYEEDTDNLIEGDETGRLTIFYEFFRKFLTEYEEAAKEWVYIDVSTSQRGGIPFYEITTMEEEARVELMEQKFPARNYNVGQFGEIQWYENFYLFQVQIKVNISEKDSIYHKYKKLQKDKNDFWFELKKDYGEYLYEGFYENTIEVNSWNLLLQALKIIKYHQTPSEEYSLTYIDGSQILGKDIELIKVGDYIKIRSEKLGLVESESNEIQVTAISRNLRDFSNIQLTVNQTRKTDSIIENLISGLNK